MMILKNKLALYAICITIVSLMIMLAFLFVFIRSGYATKFLVKLGLQKENPSANWAAFSWNNSLQKLDYDADIVFFGDSLIRGSDFRQTFPGKKIVNLGYTGDTLSGMLDRVPGVVALNPEQIFILGGINNLTEDTIEQSLQQYEQLLEELHRQVPQAQIYVHSLLPISKDRETSFRRNATIISFNQQLQNLADSKQVTYIDLFPLYAKDGYMNPALTKDGLHLHPDAYAFWATLLKDYIDP